MLATALSPTVVWEEWLVKRSANGRIDGRAA